MKSRITSRQTGLYLISALILLVGMGSAVMIYLKAEKTSGSLSGYEGAGGYGYLVAPEDSKAFRHDLELYGGKTNVLATEFMQWFAGLWRGKSLAYTVASMSVAAAMAVFFLANARRHKP